MRFIVLTTPGGIKIRFNVANIVTYNKYSDTTCVALTDKKSLFVKETPEEIDSLLITNGILVHE